MWQLWLDLKSNTNTKQGGQLRLRDFNSWVNQISLELFKEKFAQWETEQMVVDSLSRPFLVSKALITSSTGLNYSLLSYPKDYAFFSSARVFIDDKNTVVKCGSKDSVLSNLCEKNATKVDNARWGSVCTNKIIPPSLERVFITQYEGGFKVAPKEIRFVTIDYLRFPKKAKLSFVTASLPNQVLDPANTIDLEWNETVYNEFLARLELNYSKFIREPFMYGAAQRKKDTTI